MILFFSACLSVCLFSPSLSTSFFPFFFLCNTLCPRFSTTQSLVYQFLFYPSFSPLPFCPNRLYPFVPSSFLSLSAPLSTLYVSSTSVSDIVARWFIARERRAESARAFERGTRAINRAHVSRDCTCHHLWLHVLRPFPSHLHIPLLSSYPEFYYVCLFLSLHPR